MPEDEQNSLLTTAFRKLIKSDPEHTALERKNRNRMRNRVKQGLSDICLLNQYARTDDIRQIFHREHGRNAAHPAQQVDGRQELLSNQWIPARHMIALAWRGLRLNGVDKNDIFERVIIRGIEDGEADYEGVPHGRVESDVEFNQLEAVKERGIDPVEKWERGISLSSDDLREISDRLNEHPDVETIVGEDIGELIDQHLVDD